MGAFHELPQAVSIGEALAPVLEKDVRFADEPDWSDETALGIVMQDIDFAIGFEISKNFQTQMEVADDLIRQYVRIRPWPNTDKPRSALGMPVVLECVEKVIRPLHLSLFGSGKDPFLVSAVGRTKPEAARAWQALLRWAVRVSDMKEQSRLCMKTILTYGWGAMTDGWDAQTQVRRNEKYVLQGGKVVRNPEAKEDVIARPTVENVNLRNAIFDPATASQDPSKGRFWAVRVPLTAYDLDDMRKDATYDDENGVSKIPSRDDLRRILVAKSEPAKDSMESLKGNQIREYQAQKDTYPASKDPLQSPLEYIQYKTRDRIIGVLQKAIVIRNEKNKTGNLGINGCAFIDVINSMFGFGIGRLLSGEQRIQQGIINTWMDSLALSLNPVWQMLKGVGAGGQNIAVAPGKVVTTEGELKPLVQPDVSDIALKAIENSENRSYRRVGAEGGANMPTQAFRTGSGVQDVKADLTQTLQYIMEIYIDLVFIPKCKTMVEHCCENLTPAQIQQILGDETGKQYEGNDILDVYNADVKIEIISGVKLMTKQAAAQAAPLIIQLLSSTAVQDALQVQGTKFDFANFAEEYLELIGWDIDKLFVPMTDADQKRMEQKNQAMQQALGKVQQIGTQHAADLDSIDAKAASQAQVAVLKSNLKLHEQAGIEALSGNGNGQ